MNPYIFLAKTAVENYVKEKKEISPPEDLPREFFEKKSGVFITIEKEKKLRGCIGTYLPTKDNLAKEIISNAIAASTRDYRFNPIKEKELPYLSYKVYVLSQPELIKDTKELNPKKYGIIVRTLSKAKDVVFNGHLPHKTGLLLPNLEGIDTVEKQLSIACQKGGINPKTEEFIIYKFTVEKHQ